MVRKLRCATIRLSTATSVSSCAALETSHGCAKPSELFCIDRELSARVGQRHAVDVMSFMFRFTDAMTIWSQMSTSFSGPYLCRQSIDDGERSFANRNPRLLTEDHTDVLSGSWHTSYHSLEEAQISNFIKRAYLAIMWSSSCRCLEGACPGFRALFGPFHRVLYPR